MTKTAESAQPDGRSTRWNDHKEQRKARILDAALDAVNEGGADVGVQQIAERADVPRSVVYRIFKDRADLDEQLRVRILEMMMTDLAPTLTPKGTVGEAISRAVETYLQWIVKYPRLHHFLGKGSPSTRATGSKVVTGTKTAIAVQLGNLLGTILTSRGKPSKMAEPWLSASSDWSTSASTVGSASRVPMCPVRNWPSSSNAPSGRFSTATSGASAST